MDEQTFQIILAIIGLLMTVIGFFLVRTMNSFKDRQDKHSERMDKYDERLQLQKETIDQNSANIKANGEKDDLIRETMKENMNELKSQMGVLGGKFDTNSNLLTEVLTQLKISASNQTSS